MNSSSKKRFILANPGRTSSDCHARALQSMGLLKHYIVTRKNLPKGIDPALGVKYPLQFIPEYVAAKTIKSSFFQEQVRFASSPMLDWRVQQHLKPGDHLVAGFGYLNRSMEKAKEHGGLAFLESRNSHPKNFWDTVGEEYRKWGIQRDPLPAFHHRRQIRSLELADYIFVPGDFIANTYIERGISPDKILRTPLPVDTSIFKPPVETPPPNSKFTIVCTGQVSLRKGVPYLLEGFASFHKKFPNSVLKLVSGMADNFVPIMKQHFASVKGIKWIGNMPHPELVKFLQQADLFALPSLEEGMLLAALEALAVGTPVILSPNCGTADYVVESVNGSIVPIQDSQAVADKMELWYELWCANQKTYKDPAIASIPDLSQENFNRSFAEKMKKIFASGE